MNATVLFSSASAEWATPQWLFDALNARFLFTLDPCCTAATAKCPKFYTRTDDGLAHSWAGERVFMNPPYGRGDNGIEPWVRKARGEAVGGALVVGLLPARVDTEWWQCRRAFPPGPCPFCAAPWLHSPEKSEEICRSRLPQRHSDLVGLACAGREFCPCLNLFSPGTALSA